MIVKHPHLAGVQCDVPESEVQSWAESGWIVPVTTTSEAEALPKPDTRKKA